MNILILYGSLEGQTAKIAARMAEVIRDKGYQVTTLTGDDLPDDFNLDEFDAAIIGGPIHMGNYPRYLQKFVKQYHDRLNNLPSAFFTVCMAINSQKAESRQEAASYGEKFVNNTGWQPALTATFAGAVKYTQYNFVTRFIMKLISRHEGGSTDTAHDHEYTDWDKVASFTEEFVAKISGLSSEKS